MSQVNKYIAALENQIVAIRREIVGAKGVRIYFGTNDGTFGAEECHRVTGTGEPSAGRYTIYETVGGEKVVEGCDPDDAPGYFRANEYAKIELSNAKKQLKIDAANGADRIDEIEHEIKETRKLDMLTTQQAANLSRLSDRVC